MQPLTNEDRHTLRTIAIIILVLAGLELGFVLAAVSLG